MTVAIRIEQVSKRYLIGHQRQQRYSTIREVLAHYFRGFGERLLHPLSPNRENIRLEELWALRDINLEVKAGERVGIIGCNGAGKSTLLKVLSRITEPSAGRITLQGRVASLLEVGTGFHPELSGRENIFLNGAILGMSRAEIKRKFDEIVAFAETEKFLDTPVKRYSSGMYVRLAFAVAAHLEPEILVVDEVLAVGDAAFQKKCLGKMEDVGKTGRTVLFVSHNMAAINHLCDQAILLDQGRIVAQGEARLVTEQYVRGNVSRNSNGRVADTSNSEVIRSQGRCEALDIVAVSIRGGGDEMDIHTGGELTVSIQYAHKKLSISPAFVISVNDNAGLEVFRLSTQPISGFPIETLYQHGVVELTVKTLPLVAGSYYLDIGFVRENVEWLLKLERVLRFDVQLHDYYESGCALDRERGMIVVDHSWNHRRASVSPSDAAS